jgi:hypothetical protein
MKCFAPYVRRAVILVMMISASAFAQAPYARPTAPPVPRRKEMAQPRAGNRLRKLTPRKKLVPKAPTKGREGARRRRSPPQDIRGLAGVP